MPSDAGLTSGGAGDMLAPAARFRADVEALVGPPERLGIAVSGGPDSLALLLLAHAAFPGTISAATVDHALRAGSAAEAAAVAVLCAARGIPHRILERPADWPVSGQSAARDLRYTLLGRWADELGLAYVATAHQRDDVAEGFLMRAARGSGVAGLAAMRAVAPWPVRGASRARLIRPLLGWSRTELATIADGFAPATDPSNADPRYERTHARALLAAQDWLHADRLARAATNLREAETALQWLADEAWRSRATQAPGGAVTVDAAGLPRETRRRLVARALGQLSGEGGDSPVWEGDGLDRLVDRLDAGAAGTLAGVRATPGERWRFTLAPPRRGSQKHQD